MVIENKKYRKLESYQVSLFMINTYLQYGVSLEVAQKLESLKLPKSTFEKTSNNNLVSKYHLLEEEIKLVKSLIKRDPIDEDVLQNLLENSQFTCCVCNGQKGHSYIIHHINHYSVSQDNSYQNLAVLCPNDHDLAHMEGSGLTMKLTAMQIMKAKLNWEKIVRDQKVYKASVSGDIHEIEFLNIPRILEVCKEIYKKIPETEYTTRLIREDLIRSDGFLNISYIKTLANNPATPLIFFSPYGSAMLRFHYFEIFKNLLRKLNFKDLDALLNQTSIKSGIVGEYCFYVGGLYSSKLIIPISTESEMMKFYFKRKPFIVEWLVDPQYFASSSAKNRTVHRNVYTIYGKIMSVNIEQVDGGKQIVIDIRPYCFGLPNETKNRRPDIAFQKELDEFFDEDESLNPIEVLNANQIDLLNTDLNDKDLPF